MILWIVACSKEPIRESSDTPPAPPPSDFNNGVFVVNEGNFNWGNASISYIDMTDNQIVSDIFEPVNHRNLGDVAQNMVINDGKGYIVVNNSNRIEVVSLDDFTSLKSLAGFNSPRDIAFINPDKAYVSNLKGDISVVNLKTLAIKSVIKINGWTEKMVNFGNLTFITSLGIYTLPNAERNAQVFIINSLTDEIIDSLKTGKEPIGMVLDRKNKLWVLCSGGYDGFEPPSLLRIDPLLQTVEKTFLFLEKSESPSRLCINSSGDTLYFLKNGIYQMPVMAAEVPSGPFIPSDGRLFYGLGIHPATGEIYASDAVDYVQNGWVYRFSSGSGQLIHSYLAGRIPGSFCFPPISGNK